MWILAALIAAFGIAMIFQEYSGGIRQPWAECKESMVQQMFTGDCTPRAGLRPPASADTPAVDPADRPVGEIKRN